MLSRSAGSSRSHPMSTLHVIRLRGPWEYVVEARFLAAADRAAGATESTSDLPLPGRAAMPACWANSLGPDFRGRVSYRRPFGKPTGITPAERIWLVCDGADPQASLTLNDEPLGTIDGPASPAEFDVTDRLRERNVLVAIVESADRAGGLTGEVRLEIRES